MNHRGNPAWSPDHPDKPYPSSASNTRRGVRYRDDGIAKHRLLACLVALVAEVPRVLRSRRAGQRPEASIALEIADLGVFLCWSSATGCP